MYDKHDMTQEDKDMYLNSYDLDLCVRRLPQRLKKLMEKHGDKIILAGGYIRAVILNEKIADIDLFAGDKETSKKLAMDLMNSKKDLYETDNAITVKNLCFPVQFIHRWVYSKPIDVTHSFDFTICQAAIWFVKEEGKWTSQCCDTFYQDLSAKRLVYLSPIRNEDVGGSLLRVLKYYQRGYRIPLKSYANVLARLVSSIEIHTDYTEEDIAKIIQGLLYEVDPNGFFDRKAYLP